MSRKRMYRDCRRNLYRYVQVTTLDGTCLNGYIEHVDRDHVYMLVPMEDDVRDDDNENDNESDTGYGESDNRQFYPGPGFGYPGYGYPGYGYPGFGYPGYGYPGFGSGRRLRRLIVPLIFLTTLSVLD